ncbi:MAG: glycine betaine ABC transporter substrate-binding protein [Sphaerochaetaceae bacterium]|nr:glycine betaine ABC transporter substrate-binding protein [Sphaerochaetaceae bacterium]
MKKLLLFTLMITLLTPFALLANGEGETTQSVNLTYANWEEGVAWTHFIAAVLEDEYGYEVNLTAADVAPGISAVANGDQDFFMEGWLPTLHGVYVDGTDIVKIKKIYDNGITGLIIPKYMADDGVTKLSDLAKPDVAKKLDYKITGIDAGAGMMIQTEEQLIPAYGLDDAGIRLLASSGPAMMAALDGAIENEEYIVGMGWQPHSMFGLYDLVILEQDGKEIFAPNDIYILGRNGVEEDLPEVTEFMKNVYWTNETIGPLMVHLQESNLDTLEAARQWKDENTEIWSDWVN